MEKRRCHPTAILERTYRSALALLAFLFANFWGVLVNGEDGLSSLGGRFSSVTAVTLLAAGALLILVLMVVYQFFFWKSAVYWIENNMLCYESGVFTRRKIEMAADKINTVDANRGLFGILFGTSHLKIDSGNVTQSKKAEFELILATSEAFRLRDELLARKTGAPPAASPDAGSPPPDLPAAAFPVFRARPMDFLKLSFTGNRLILFGFSLLAFFGGLSGILPDRATESFFEKLLETAGWAAVVTAAVLIYLVITVLVTVVSTFLRYYGFAAWREGDRLRMTYGLIHQRSYTFPADKVHAVTASQTILQRALGLWAVEVCVIGYGGEKNEEAVLFPICSREDRDRIIAALLPEFTLLPPSDHCKKGTLGLFLVRPALWTLAAAVPAFAVHPLFWLLQILSVLIWLSAFLQYADTGIGAGMNTLVAVNGGLSRTITYIRLHSVQSLGERRGPLQRKTGCCTLRVDYYAPALRSIIVLRQLPASLIGRYEEAVG